MEKNIYSLAVAVIIGFLFTVPFFILEAITTSGFSNLGFPLTLFILMWINGALFVFILMSILISLRSQKRSNIFYIFLILKIGLLIILAWAWADVIIDQWPCFIGVPNCD